jgi:hypothetical protein
MLAASPAIGSSDYSVRRPKQSVHQAPLYARIHPRDLYQIPSWVKPIPIAHLHPRDTFPNIHTQTITKPRMFRRVRYIVEVVLWRTQCLFREKRFSKRETLQDIGVYRDAQTRSLGDIDRAVGVQMKAWRCNVHFVITIRSRDIARETKAR